VDVSEVARANSKIVEQVPAFRDAPLPVAQLDSGYLFHYDGCADSDGPRVEHDESKLTFGVAALNANVATVMGSIIEGRVMAGQINRCMGS
jgi:hypothetical protein